MSMNGVKTANENENENENEINDLVNSFEKLDQLVTTAHAEILVAEYEEHQAAINNPSNKLTVAVLSDDGDENALVPAEKSDNKLVTKTENTGLMTQFKAICTTAATVFTTGATVGGTIGGYLGTAAAPATAAAVRQNVENAVTNTTVEAAVGLANQVGASYIPGVETLVRFVSRNNITDQAHQAGLTAGETARAQSSVIGGAVGAAVGGAATLFGYGAYRAAQIGYQALTGTNPEQLAAAQDAEEEARQQPGM